MGASVFNGEALDLPAFRADEIAETFGPWAIESSEPTSISAS